VTIINITILTRIKFYKYLSKYHEKIQPNISGLALRMLYEYVTIVGVN
jgi:hypothetical protein